MALNKVLIAVITDEYARRADFYDYYHMMEKPEGSFVAFNHSRSPARGRNELIHAAQEKEMTHILLIDDDMAYPPNALNDLLKHDVDIVSGLYLSRAYPHNPLAFDLADDDGSAFPMYLTEGKTGLHPVVATGFGFCLIKMTVFEKLERPYIRLGELNPQEWCDDIGFFNRVGKVGVKSYVDLDVKCGHMGTMIVWPDFKDNKWFSGYDTNGNGKINIPQFVPKPEYEMREK